MFSRFGYWHSESPCHVPSSTWAGLRLVSSLQTWRPTLQCLLPRSARSPSLRVPNWWWPRFCPSPGTPCWPEQVLWAGSLQLGSTSSPGSISMRRSCSRPWVPNGRPPPRDQLPDNPDYCSPRAARITGWMPFAVVRLSSPVRLFETPWATAHRVPLPSTISWSLLKFMFIDAIYFSW